MHYDPDNPMLKKARELAHKRQLSQEAFTEIAGLYFEDAAARYSQFKDWQKKEDAALGENREARKEALDKQIQAIARESFSTNNYPGQDFSEADAVIAHFRGTPMSSLVFRLFEKMGEARSRQGVMPYSSAGREAREGRSDGLPDNWDTLDSVSQRTWQLQNPQWRAAETARRH
jgi:hypothetical protein